MHSRIKTWIKNMWETFTWFHMWNITCKIIYHNSHAKYNVWENFRWLHLWNITCKMQHLKDVKSKKSCTGSPIWDKDRLKRSLTELAMTSAHSTISLAGISSGPVAFLIFNPFKPTKTSLTLRTISDNEGWVSRQ